MKQLDETDRRIVQHLREDGRRPYAAIARDVGLSEAAVRQRVGRLLRDRAIHISAATRPTRQGFITACLSIRVEQGRHEEVARAIAALPEAEFVAVCIGACDVTADVVCETRERLYQVVVEKIRSLPGVRDADVSLYAHVVRDQLAWRSPAE
jgi:Lrp/AsnC family transcriptional regulator for asnA, asnC and gidA